MARTSTDPCALLTELLNSIGHGPIPERYKSRIENQLIDCWPVIAGAHEGGMLPEKLTDRVEKLTWNPPILTFTIARHGATVHGSSREHLQDWTIDLAQRTADFVQTRFRQVTPRAKPLKVEPLAEEIADCILHDKPHKCLVRKVKGEVFVKTVDLIPGSGQTKQGRNRRFRKHLDKLLNAAGWAQIPGRAYYTYAKVSARP